MKRITLFLLLSLLISVAFAIPVVPRNRPPVVINMNDHFTAAFNITVISSAIIGATGPIETPAANKDFWVVNRDSKIIKKIRTDSAGKVAFSIDCDASSNVNIPLKGITDYPHDMHPGLAQKYWPIKKEPHGTIVGQYRYVVYTFQPPIMVARPAR